MPHFRRPFAAVQRLETPDRAYAEAWAQKTGGTVSYVDIPVDSPLLTKAFDDSGTSMVAPFNAFEAPPEIAAQLRPVPETQPAEAKAPPAPPTPQPEPTPAPQPEPAQPRQLTPKEQEEVQKLQTRRRKLMQQDQIDRPTKRGDALRKQLERVENRLRELGAMPAQQKTPADQTGVGGVAGEVRDNTQGAVGQTSAAVGPAATPRPSGTQASPEREPPTVGDSKTVQRGADAVKAPKRRGPMPPKGHSANAYRKMILDRWERENGIEDLEVQEDILLGGIVRQYAAVLAVGCHFSCKHRRLSVALS